MIKVYEIKKAVLKATTVEEIDNLVINGLNHPFKKEIGTTTRCRCYEVNSIFFGCSRWEVCYGYNKDNTITVEGIFKC